MRVDTKDASKEESSGTASTHLRTPLEDPACGASKKQSARHPGEWVPAGSQLMTQTSVSVFDMDRKP